MSVTRVSSEIYSVISATEAAKAAFDSGDLASVVTILNTGAHESTDSSRRDSNWITNNFSAEDADTIFNTLQNSDVPRVIAANAMLSGRGLDLSNATVQQLVPVLGNADNWGEELINTVLRHGKWFATPAELQFGKDCDPVTLSEVQGAADWAEIAQRLTAAYNSTMNEVNSGSITTWDDALASINEG